MKREIILIGIAFSILLAATATRSVTAQNLTTNASNAAGNMSAAVNQTGSELGKNATEAVGNASQSVNQTMNEVGKNASATGQSLLNQTAEVAKKIVSGGANVLSNISGEIKKGIGAK